MVRERKFDAGELAIGTFLEAKTYGKPVTLLPAVVMGRFQHQCALRATARGTFGPGDIEGRRIGIRSYTQTTGIWVRGIFQHEYGVDLNKVTLGVQRRRTSGRIQGPAECRAHAGRTPRRSTRCSLDGEIDGAILGAEIPDEPRVAHLIPESERGGARLAPQVRHHPGQPPDVRRQGARRRAAGRGRVKSSAC